MPFQTSVPTQPSPAVEGDFCDSNPRFAVDAGPGGMVAGAAGVIVGRFAWWSPERVDGDNAPAIVNNFGSGPPTGFVHREQQGLLTQYLAETTMLVQPGFPITLHSGGGFWVKNNGSTAALVGQKAFTNFADGKVSFAAAGATPATASFTGSISAQTASLTGSIAGNVLTVTAVGSGTLVPGGALSGTAGGGIASGTKIVGQLSGTIGGVGRYSLNIPDQTIPSGPITETYGLLNVSAVSAGVLGVGDILGGTGVVAGTHITQLGTGAGLTGTYIVDGTQAMSSSALTASLAIETKWIAMSMGQAGELVKITDHPLG